MLEHKGEARPNLAYQMDRNVEKNMVLSDCGLNTVSTQ